MNKRKVFLESEDERSQLEIIKELQQKKGFEVVSNIADADILFKFEIGGADKIQIGTNPGIFGGLSTSSTFERPEGKLTVYLLQDNNEYLIFAKKKELGFVGQYLHKQVIDLTKDFLKELKKAESQATPKN